VKVVTFYPAASSTLSWKADEELRLIAVSSSIDALVSLDPQLTWLQFVTRTAGTVQETVEFLLRSTYSVAGDPNLLDRFIGLDFEVPKGQTVFVHSGSTGGVVQLMFQLNTVQHVVIDNV